MQTASPPPPPRKNSRRRYRRYELLASVEVIAARETLLLPARNISLGGVYLAADGHDLAAFGDGTEVEVQVFDALDEGSRAVRLTAKVVRHDEGGMALMWAGDEAATAEALAPLLATLPPADE